MSREGKSLLITREAVFIKYENCKHKKSEQEAQLWQRDSATHAPVQ